MFRRPLILVMLVAGCAGKASVPVASGPTQAVPPTVSDPVFVGTVEQLQKEWAADKDAAKQKYQDHLVEVSGRVVNVRWVLDDHRAHIDLTSDDAKPAVVCSLHPTAYEAGWRLTKGQEVRIRGKWYDQRTWVMLGFATVVQAGPSSALSLTADQLALDYTAGDADAKYKDKPMFVEGTVLDADPHWKSQMVVFDTSTAGKPRLPVVVEFSDGFKAELSSFTKGQKILVRGTCDGISEGGEVKMVKLGRHVRVREGTVFTPPK